VAKKERKSKVLTTDIVLVKSPELTPMGEVEGIDGKVYTLVGVDGKAVAETESFKVFIARSATQTGLFKIAQGPANNAELDQEANNLKLIQQIAAEIDEETKGERKPHYGIFFPVLQEQIDADGRVGLILGFDPAIESYKRFTPVSNIAGYVDFKTLAWFLGKGLKSLGLIHDMGKKFGMLDASNIFVEKELHGVLFFNSAYMADANEAEQLAEVAAFAQIAWTLAGGAEESEPPFSESVMTREKHDKFVSFLNSLRVGMEASEAHEAAYQMFDEIWPKGQKTDEHGTVTKRDFHVWKEYDRK